MTEVDDTTGFNKMATVDGPPHSFQARLRARANTVPTNLTSQMSTDDDAFHHLAVQLNLIDTSGHRDGSRGATPKLTSSPTIKYSPDLTTAAAAATIDLVHYSGLGGSIDNMEAASNKYF